MSFTASARRIGNTLRHEVDVNGRHTIVTDEPAQPRRDRHRPRAARAAAGDARLVRLDDDRALRAAKGVGHRRGPRRRGLRPRGEPRRFDVTVHLPDGLTDDQVTRLERVADGCPVRRALEAGFTFDERIGFPAQDPAVPSTPDA